MGWCPDTLDMFGHSAPPVLEGEPEGDSYSTPLEVLDLVREASGPIDTDPASNAAAQKFVQARVHYTAQTNGLDPRNTWGGVTWLNPPYSRGRIGPFIERALHEWGEGNLSCMWVLTNAAVNTKWFHTLAQDASLVMFPPARIQFWHPTAPQGSNRYEQVLCYFGSSTHPIAKPVKVFEREGWLVTMRVRVREA